MQVEDRRLGRVKPLSQHLELGAHLVLGDLPRRVPRRRRRIAEAQYLIGPEPDDALLGLLQPPGLVQQPPHPGRIIIAGHHQAGQPERTQPVLGHGDPALQRLADHLFEGAVEPVWVIAHRLKLVRSSPVGIAAQRPNPVLDAGQAILAFGTDRLPVRGGLEASLGAAHHRDERLAGHVSA